LGEGRRGGEGGGRDQRGTQKYCNNAIVAHKIKSPIYVMTRLIQGHCVQNLLRRGNTKSSQYFKYLNRRLVPGLERFFGRFGRF
jgi:hypothetical protein